MMMQLLEWDVVDYNEYETMSHDDVALEMEHIELWAVRNDVT